MVRWAGVVALLLCACGPAATEGPPVDGGAPAADAGRSDGGTDTWTLDASGAFPTDASPPFDGNGGACVGPGEPCGDPNEAPGGCCDPSSYSCVRGRCALGLCCGTEFVGDASACVDGGAPSPCW